MSLIDEISFNISKTYEKMEVWEKRSNLGSYNSTLKLDKFSAFMYICHCITNTHPSTCQIMCH